MQGQEPGNHLVMTLGLAVLVSLQASSPLRCQEVLPPKLQADANVLFDQTSQTERLNCTIQDSRPFLDFTFHFDAGFRITCPFGEFGGKRTRVTILVRVTPEGGTPVVLGNSAIFRDISVEPLAGRDNRKVYYVASGGFSVGEGRYRVEVLMADPLHRTCRRAWWIKVTHRRQKSVPVVLAARQVASLHIPPWRGPQANGGLRLAVLLSAGSFSPRATRLGAGYQMMLLQMLSSLLQQVPCESVRLVAFNLDQEQVIYRADPFMPSGFARLQRAFNGLSLGVVSVETLQKRNEWPEMLARLANEQLSAKPPPDAVIILGRSFRWVRKVPREMLMFPYPGMPGFFYFENGPQNLFPDSLGLFTKGLGGKTYRITTPHDLGIAIERMLQQLREAKKSSQPGLTQMGK
ncbi:MAG TPA: hypothetical protein VNM47_15800 [Terriglobia bacterium]|nr:hypothetical protein [Terriglobia bacterium]